MLDIEIWVIMDSPKEPSEVRGRFVEIWRWRAKETAGEQ